MTIYSLYFVPANLTLDHTLSLYTQLHSVIKGLIYQAQEFGFVRRVYAPQLVSHHTKDLEWWTLKPPRRVTALGSWTDCVIALMSRADHVIALRQISVTALLYLEDSRPVHLQGMRTCRFKDAKRRVPQRSAKRERERALWLLFLSAFSFPLGLSYANWAQAGALFYLKSSPRPRTFLWPSSALFSQAFPFLSFSRCHFGLLFPILTT